MKCATSITIPMTSPGVSRGTVNQNPSIFVLKNFDQSNCSVSLGKMVSPGKMTDRKYFCEHTVLNITTYKKIRVKRIFVYFMKIHGNCRVSNTKYTLGCVTFL